MAWGPFNAGGGGGSSGGTAADISYDNSKSGISAANVQEAIDAVPDFRKNIRTTILVRKGVYKEKIVVPKIELPEEYQEELDRKLRQIKKNDVVTAVFFFKGEYLQKKGMVSRIDTSARVIQIVNTKICIDDLYDIDKENEMM